MVNKSPPPLQTQRYQWNDETLYAAADAIAIHTKHKRELESLRTTAIFGMQAILQSDQRYTLRLLQAHPPKCWQGEIAVYISMKPHELSVLQKTRTYLRTLDAAKFSNGDVIALALHAICHPLLRLPLPHRDEIIE